MSSRFAVSFLISIFALSAQAATPSKRLIELGNGKRVWMTRAEVRQLALKTKALRKVGGFMDITDDQTNEVRPVKHVRDFDGSDPTEQATVSPMLAKLSADSLLSFDRQIEAVGERYYDSDNGIKGSEFMRDSFLKLANGRQDVTVEYFKHNFKMPSVICRIKGSGPKADERVIIGGHHDSVGGPGADDDGSGSITLLEVFRVLMESGFVPNRTIEFIAYAGEEGGLLGSMDIAKKYKADGVKVAGVLQFDMTMFTNGGKNKVVQLVTGGTDKTLTDFVAKLFKAYTTVDTKMVSGVGGSTDSASWNRQGYPAAWPFEPIFNNLLHSPKDLHEALDPAMGLEFAKVGVAFAVEVSH